MRSGSDDYVSGGDVAIGFILDLLSRGTAMVPTLDCMWGWVFYVCFETEVLMDSGSDKVVRFRRSEMCIQCMKVVKVRALRVRECVAYFMSREVFFEGVCHECGHDSTQEE